MGLLSYINAMEQNHAETSQGLLAKATQYDLQVNDFYAWCENQNFSHAALFQRNENTFSIVKAIGLDAETIARSYSSKDFWNGTLKADAGWQSFSKEETEFATFNQFLSEAVCAKAQTLHFIKLEDSILMLVQEDDDFTLSANSETVKHDIIQILYAHPEPEDLHALESSINKGLQVSNATLFLLSVKSAVDADISGVTLTDAAHEKILQTIYDEIYRICAQLFQKPNCCVLGKNGELKIAFFAKDEVDEELMHFHIANALSEIISAENSNSIALLTAGICPDTKGTLAFMQQS